MNYYNLLLKYKIKVIQSTLIVVIQHNGSTLDPPTLDINTKATHQVDGILWELGEVSYASCTVHQ